MRTAIAAAALLASSAWAQVPRLEFKGVPLGATVQEVRKLAPNPSGLSCLPVDRWKRMACLTHTTTFANHPVTELQFIFDEGKLTAVSATMRSDAFDDVAGALAEKYGNPKGTAVSTRLNAMGAKVEARLTHWNERPDGGLIGIQEHSPRIGSAMVMMMSAEHAAANKRRETAAPAKKDI